MRMQELILQARNSPTDVLRMLGGARRVEAGMDLTRWTNDNARHWKDADSLSGRSAYPLIERKTARERSRLEAENNSWYSGILRTSGNHIVSIGPRLQVLTDNPDANARIERAWNRWALEIGFAEKLRLCVETYWRDGEIFGMRSRRPWGQIDLDIRLYEGDQVSQPYKNYLDTSVEDGKRVDNCGNMVEAWILDHHPGDFGLGYLDPMGGDWYPADVLFHLFRADRPGQIRGIPRCSPGIEGLAHMRRFCKATLRTAEQASNLGLFAKTNSTGITPAEMPSGYAVDWVANAINFMPKGWEWDMLDLKQPSTTYEMYSRMELMYFCRCANLPYSLASGTSKDSNFASAKMDIKNLWEPEVKSEQDKIASVVLAKVFRWFLEECIFAGLLDGAPDDVDQIDYHFYWPPLPQSDEIDVANAAVIRMTSGQTTPRQESMARGEDFDSKIRTGAEDYGVSPEEYKRAIFAKHFAITGLPGGSGPMSATTTSTITQTPAIEPSDALNNSSLMQREGMSQAQAIAAIEQANANSLDELFAQGVAA